GLMIGPDGRITFVSTQTFPGAQVGNITESQVTGLTSDLASKANAASIAGATNTKITYNSQGIVTSGASLAAGDIPNIAESQVTNLTSDLAGKASNATVVHLTGNETIAGTKTFSSPISGSVTGSAASITGSVTESQV